MIMCSTYGKKTKKSKPRPKKIIELRGMSDAEIDETNAEIRRLCHEGKLVFTSS